MSELGKKILYDFLGQYNYHCFSNTFHLLELDFNNKQVRLSPTVFIKDDSVNYDLQLGNDFKKIQIMHDEHNKVIYLFSEDEIEKLRFDYISYLAFNPLVEDD